MKFFKKITAISGILALGVLAFFLFLPYGVYLEFNVKFNPMQAWSFVSSQAPIEYIISAAETDLSGGRVISICTLSW
jgi:hypothetical protein